MPAERPILTDSTVCTCGNRSDTDGFFPCNEEGAEVDPGVGDFWQGLYVCDRCGKVYESAAE